MVVKGNRAIYVLKRETDETVHLVQNVNNCQ